MKIATLLVLSSITGIAFMTGKFFVYDRCYEDEVKETFKLFYIILDTFKDIGTAFLILNYLLK